MTPMKLYQGEVSTDRPSNNLRWTGVVQARDVHQALAFILEEWPLKDNVKDDEDLYISLLEVYFPEGGGVALEDFHYTHEDIDWDVVAEYREQIPSRKAPTRAS